MVCPLSYLGSVVDPVALYLPGVAGDQLGNVGGGDGVDGVLYDVDDPVARLNVRLLHLGLVHGDGGLKV